MVKNYSQFFYKDKITKPECILTDGITFVQIHKENRISIRIKLTKISKSEFLKKYFISRTCGLSYAIFFSRLTHGELFIVESEGLLETEDGEIVQIRGRVHQLTSFGVKQYRRGS
jgi:hypothetical protein